MSFTRRRALSARVLPVLGLLGVSSMLLVAPRSAAAQVTTFTTRASFNAANPGLPLEDFEEATLAPSTFGNITGPLNTTSNNIAFVPGDILPGLSLVDNPGPDSNGLVVLGTGTVIGTT